MRKAAIYARFSTDLQNERSIEDQVALCRLYAERERLNADKVYEDRARSGGSVIGRDGLSALLNDARNGLFQVLIVEALDRLSRDMEDLAGLHKRLTFLDIEIRAVHEGQVNTALVGLRGLIGQLYREDNAHKVRRGLAGCIREGRSAGGLAYGYRAVPGEPGKYAILEEEAAVVRRIFAEYLDGKRPRAIAAGLNEDCVPPPRGKRWNGSTINGNTKRGNGILHNEIYVGRLVWNKVRMVKDPATGRRVSRENPASEHRVAESPELRIVEPDVFKAAQALKRSRGGLKPHAQRRSKHLLSGLLRCGSCGSGMSSAGSDRQGVRVRCSRAKESGDCPDPKTFYLATIEAAVLSGLREELRKPAVIAEYVREYHAERQRLAASANEVRARLEKRLAEIDQEAERCIDHLVKGIGDAQRIGARSKELGIEEAKVRAELAKAPPTLNVVNLHPAVLARYETQIANLQMAASGVVATGDTKAAEALRELVDSVVVSRDPSRVGGVIVEITGRLNALLGEKAWPNGVRSSVGSMVAEEGLEPPTRGL
jgi:DNA invertase Pin-like site-specific DNA recombinase